MKILAFLLGVSLLHGDTIGVIGSGYVGLLMSATLAHWDHNVICIDIDKRRIQELQNHQVPFFEPSLEELLFQRNIRFSSDIEDLENIDMAMICVGTPSNDEGDCDLTAINHVMHELSTLKAPPLVVCIKSTVPPGTIRNIEEKYRESFEMIYNPEFMREGSAFADVFTKNPIVLGSRSDYALNRMQKLYEPLLEGKSLSELIKTTPETAELIKYGWNGFSALRLTYINELSRLCNSFSADASTLIYGISLSEKLLPTVEISPSWGFGGSCLPKDTRTLAHLFESEGCASSLIHQTIESNQNHQDFILNKILQTLGPFSQKVGVFGLAFKANTSDLRGAFSIPLVGALIENGHVIHLYDSHAIPEFKKIYPDALYFDSIDEALDGIDSLIILNDSEEFKTLDLAQVKKLMRGKNLIDLRNLLSPQLAKEQEFTILNVGRS